MEKRERVLKALNIEEPDRVPLDVWCSPAFRVKLQKHLSLKEAAKRRPLDFLALYLY